MNKKVKFESFLESLKGGGHDDSIGSIREGFRACIEGYEEEADFKKHLGPWENEKSWGIEESRPIKVNVTKSWTGDYYVIKPEPMTMRYETYEHLGMNHRVQDIDVSQSSYDYETGEASFVAESMEDVEKWLEKYSGIVVKGE